MRFSKYGLLAILLGVCIACNNTTQSSISTPPTPTLLPKSIPSATSTPMTDAEYVLSQIPHCESIKMLDQPIKFSWPNVDQRIKDLQGSAWGYFSCAQAPSAVSAFYREQILKPPYNRQETNWIDRSEGTLGIYFQTGSQNWLYMWVVPQSNDKQKAYVIVAVTSSEAFEPECRRWIGQHRLS
jgi:hypothetical protein